MKTLSIAILFSLCLSAHAFPTWMGVYGSFVRHNGVNPGIYTILMNQDYYGLHAEVGVQVNGGGYTTSTMSYIGNVDGNSVWQYEVGTAYTSNDYVQFYFHGWDDWNGNIYDNNGGWNYSFTAGAAELDWVGNSTLPAIIAGHDTWVGIESWPRNAGVDAFSIFAYDGTWGGATLSYSGATNNNDVWRGSIGRFSASSEVQLVLGVEDEAGHTLYDNNNGSNYLFTVQPGSAVQWLGNVYHWPTNGALTSTNDLWLNLFAYPSQTVVQAYARYAVNGMIWQYADLSYLEMAGTNEWWHANLGLMPPGASVYYLFDVEDGAGIWQVVPSNGAPYTATVSGDSTDSDADELPDDWELFRLGTLDYSTTDNPDHDGYTAMPLDNWMEYCIGADPAVSNQASDIRLMGYPSRPFQGGWVKLSVAANTNEDLYGTAITAVLNDGSGTQTAILTQASSGRFEGALQLSSNTSSLAISRLTGNGSTNDNYTLGWSIPVRALAYGESADSDGDGLPDEWETIYGLDPLDNGITDADSGASGDPDEDEISNLIEYQHGLDPQTFNVYPAVQVLYPMDGSRL